MLGNRGRREGSPGGDFWVLGAEGGDEWEDEGLRLVLI